MRKTRPRQGKRGKCRSLDCAPCGRSARDDSCDEMSAKFFIPLVGRRPMDTQGRLRAKPARVKAKRGQAPSASLRISAAGSDARKAPQDVGNVRSEEHTSELQSR